MPGTGRLYTSPQTEQKPEPLESKAVPAAFTFVGQFIDHDLTLNALNLFEPQSGLAVDSASPLIDLDSVYGPRPVLADLARDIGVLDENGALRLDASRSGVIDVPREHNKNAGTEDAVIFDARNDENQMILQVHILVMRLHNAFIAQGDDYARARRRTILNWQAFIVHDYLSAIIRPDVLQQVLAEIEKKDFGSLRHKPLLDMATGRLIVTMPHEFAIGFRMGHSQLRPGYQIQDGVVKRLFNNRLTAGSDADGIKFDDLRGGQKLRADHQIDWSFFLDQLANGIDSHVTSVVFDLPESAIPDEIKFVGNLPHRNLIRSDKVGLCSGEDLANMYGLTPNDPSIVEPDAASRHLFESGGTFATPLWYYLLREAEHEAGGGPVQTLGELGSHLVAEVIVGGIAYNPDEISYFKQKGDAADWSITGKSRVAFRDILSFVARDKVSVRS